MAPRLRQAVPREPEVGVSIFRGIISRDGGTPWPATGMTSAKWLDVPCRAFYIANLIATQPGVLFAGLTEPPRPPVGGDPYPHVIEWDGRLFLEDGHHRVTRAALAGRRYITARHLLIESEAAA